MDAPAPRPSPSPSPRLACRDDIPAIAALMERAIGALQHGFLDREQVAASRLSMGLDTQLIEDGSYFVVERDGRLAGCGGWSFRATLYGGNHSVSLRDGSVLDPACDPARIRAMYTDPDFARRGIGRLILSTCENAARAAGFGRAEMMATLAGEPLYRACGYETIARVARMNDSGVAVPGVRMGKTLQPRAVPGVTVASNETTSPSRNRRICRAPRSPAAPAKSPP